MSYADASLTMLAIVVVVAFVFWGPPRLTREKPLGPAAFRARGCAGGTPAYEGNSASAVSGYIVRSA